MKTIMTTAALVFAAIAPAQAGENHMNKADWTDEVASIIEQKMQYPLQALQRGDEGSAQIALYIDKSGKVTAVQQTRYTGKISLDTAINSMVNSIDQVPAPAFSSKDRVKLYVTLNYDFAHNAREEYRQKRLNKGVVGTPEEVLAAAGKMSVKALGR